MATFNTSSTAAMPTVSAPSKPSEAVPLPLPSSAGSAIDRPPMMVKFSTASTGSRQSLGARTRAALVRRVKP